MKKILFKSDFFGDVEINLTEAISGKKVLITEEITRSDIERIQKIIDSSLNKYNSSINQEIIKAVKKEMGSKATEDTIVEITTNCLVQLYKALWSKRGFWKSAISNKSN